MLLKMKSEQTATALLSNTRDLNLALNTQALDPLCTTEADFDLGWANTRQ